MLPLHMNQTLPQKLSFVDLETTGASIFRDRIIEIGIVRVEGNRIVDEFESLINPNCYVPKEIKALTGINTYELESAPSFYQLKNEILEKITDSVFVAHNVRFDYGFLKNEFRRFDISFSPKHFCTVKLSRSLYPQFSHHNLDAIMERFNIKCKRRHRALDDAKATFAFFKKSQKQIPQDIFSLALLKALKKPSIPIKVSESTLNNLPESTGVYIFKGENNSCLYVGKSINIKDRVLSHFSSDYSSNKEMQLAQQTEDIETIITSGELGALLLESTLVKKLQPLYNRKLRSAFSPIVVKKVIKNGYQTVELDSSGQIDISHLEEIITILRNKKSAKEFLTNIAKKYNLCGKLLGVDITNKVCFGYRLGTCDGACIGIENILKYNLKFIEAFSQIKVKSWPFNGPIIIREKDEEGNSQGFIMDKWCYLGSLNKDNSDNFDEINQDYSFDFDTYKILLRYITNEKNQKNIQRINLNPSKTSENHIDNIGLIH